MKRSVLAVIGIVVIVVVAAAAFLLMQPGGKIEVKKIKVAAIYVTPLEEPWNMNMHLPLDKVSKEMGFTYSYNEKVSDADVERVMREFISKGYNIIIPHSWSFTKAVEAIYKEFPDVYFLFSGSELYAKNLGQYAYSLYESWYLSGMLMGGMTKTNKIGVVAPFPGTEMDRMLNAIEDGIHAINTSAQMRTVYIESWFDPAKAKEAAIGLINQGYDFLFAERDGVIDACKERNVLTIGQMGDQVQQGPDVVVTSTIWDLSPVVREVVTRYAAGTLDGRYFYAGLKEGGSTLAPYRNLESKIPSDLKAKVEQAKADLIAGKNIFHIRPLYPKSLGDVTYPTRYASLLSGD